MAGSLEPPSKPSSPPNLASPPESGPQSNALASSIRALTLGVPSVTESATNVLTYPPNVVPPEIFRQIIGYLPRKDIKALRLVCKEFDSKILPFFLRQVVVTFKSDLFGQLGAGKKASGERHDGEEKEGKAPKGETSVNGTSEPKDYGMRIFRDFGEHITRFGMSFEIDEETILRVPTKKHTKTITAFWGRYEWPMNFYPRFKHCQALEDTADQTALMTRAFSSLSRVTELGLSMDNGHGWLRGPDVTWYRRLCKSRMKPEVFQRRDYGLTIEQQAQDEAWEDLLRHIHEYTPDEKHHFLRKLKSLEQLPYFVAQVPSPARLSSDGRTDELLGGLGRIAENVFSPDLFLKFDDPPSPVLPQPSGDTGQNPGGSVVEQGINVPDVSGDSTSVAYKPDPQYRPYWHPGNGIVPGHITPNHLTRGQREWLLETDWAQRAFLSSYTLAIIDNRPTMRNIRVLFIARIPSKYLDMLCRSDFWSTLESLQALSIFVTPDWRKIERHGEDISTVPIFASLSVYRFYELLSRFIGPLERVRKLRIGWSEGGEHAPGMFARNQHVMPAPLVPKAGHMYSRMFQGRVPKPQLLQLPHVIHLTLCNCWVSRSVLMDLTMEMRSMDLRVIRFDSVSLSTRGGISKLPIGHNPPHLQDHNAPHTVTLADGSSSSPNLAVPPIPSPLFWYRHHPPEGSWVEYIDRFTPGKTLAQTRYDAGYSVQRPPPTSMKDRLIEMHFLSCGYVRAFWGGRPDIGPPAERLAGNIAMLKRRKELIEPAMVKSRDRYLGYIIPHLRYGEMNLLRNAFGMHEGWLGDKCNHPHESTADGQPVGGTGRFSGILEYDRRDHE